MMTRDSDSSLVVLTTLENADDAKTLVKRLVTDRLVACGTIFPNATSLYRWEGKLEEAGEVMVMLKTRRERWEALKQAVRELHPYNVPELLALPVEAGLPEYLAWVQGETS